MNARKKILVIDDEPSIVIYLTTLLSDEGYDCCSATDAVEGLALARSEAPDLICIDIMMPKRSGVALYRDIWHHPELRDIPILFVSAYTQVHNTLTPQDPEFFRMLISDEDIPEPKGFIEKPIKVAEFIQTVTSLIGPGVQPSIANTHKEE